MTRKRFLTIFFATVALLALPLAVACGDDDDADPTATATSATASATASTSASATTSASSTASATGSATPAAVTTPASETKLRLGYFPNITHAQPLVGVADGTFEEALGSNVELEVKTFNAGPAVIEALFAGAIDAAYIGPNPAINGYVQSDGEALRIVAGATSAGASLVVRSDANITSPADFAGKKIATPQLGNTQDVALRAWLGESGLKTTQEGGNVTVLPTANADALGLFQRGDIQAAWVPEPWATRLVQEAGGEVFLDERTLWPDGAFVTTHLIVSTDFLEEYPDVVEALVRANVTVTQFINENPEEAKTLVNGEIERITSAAIPDAVINAAWENIDSTWDPITSSLYKSADDAYELGFLEDEPDLAEIYDLSILNKVLGELGLPEVEVATP